MIHLFYGCTLFLLAICSIIVFLYEFKTTKVVSDVNVDSKKNYHLPYLNRNDEVHATCLRISSTLDVNTWPRLVYHKDLVQNYTDTYFDSSKFSSVDEDDHQARSTIEEFNELRPLFLTRHLLDSGFAQGSQYRSKVFANRLIESSAGRGPPLVIAVFGSSFTFGRNCGESSHQSIGECAWPSRLSRRWMDVICHNKNACSCEVEWRMFQEGAQSSVNIAQKIHAVMEEFSSKGTTPDAILLDNSITDLNHNNKLWFEAVVRVFAQSYPAAVIFSVLDAVPRLVNPVPKSNDDMFLQHVYEVQKHYGLVKVDLAKMARLLRQISSVDLLWPHADRLVKSDGTKVSAVMEDKISPVYWDNYLPRVQKTKNASFPVNHPPWPTHALVADSVLYSFLKVMHSGLGCSDSSTGDEIDEALREMRETPLEIYSTTVSPRKELDACFVCLSPLAQIDAKSSFYTNMTSTYSTITKNDVESSVVETCGDWKWTTDEKNRSGWQSDEFGSLIRFRLKLSQKPSLSMTFMSSHSTFGSLRVSLQAVSKVDDKPLVGCEESINQRRLPYIQLSGEREEFSLWDTVVFPAKWQGDPNSHRAWKLFNQTVLSKHNAKYVDLYVENPNNSASKSRIKIQTVTSC